MVLVFVLLAGSTELLPELSHITVLRSGSHSPFDVQVAELDLMRANPGGQLKLMIVPSLNGKSSL